MLLFAHIVMMVPFIKFYPTILGDKSHF